MEVYYSRSELLDFGARMVREATAAAATAGSLQMGSSRTTRSVRRRGAAAAVTLSCEPEDLGDPPAVRWEDRDTNARISPGDTVVVSGGTCGD